MQVNLSSPDITSLEIKSVLEVLKTPILSIGPKVKEFENAVASFVGAKYAIAVNSGTSGLHLIVKSLGIEDGDEVITTPFSFVSSSNCILFERATPVFVDIDPQTLNIDYTKIEEKITPRTKAILPVHVFGHPANMDEINEIAKKHNLYVIEDSCEALGAKYKGNIVGTQSTAAVFAFYPNKQITTGEGGMITTNDEAIADLCYSMRNQGRDTSDQWLHHVRLGYNYRLDELSAALGIAQMQRLKEILSKRTRIASLYKEMLGSIPEVTIPYEDPDVEVSWFVYVIRLHEDINRDKVMQGLQKAGIGCKPYFQPIHLQPFYSEKFGFMPNDMPLTEAISSTTLALPFHNNLTLSQLDYVVEQLRKVINLQKTP